MSTVNHTHSTAAKQQSSHSQMMPRLAALFYSSGNSPRLHFRAVQLNPVESLIPRNLQLGRKLTNLSAIFIIIEHKLRSRELPVAVEWHVHHAHPNTAGNSESPVPAINSTATEAKPRLLLPSIPTTN